MSDRTYEIAADLSKDFKRQAKLEPIAPEIDNQLDMVAVFYELQKHAEKTHTKSFHITEIEQTGENETPMFSRFVTLTKKGRKKDIVADRLGRFKVTFSDGSIALYAKYVSGEGQNATIEQITVTDKKTWENLLKIIKGYTTRGSGLKNGIYRVSMSQQGADYERVKKIPNTPTVHEEVKKLHSDLEYFFSHLDQYKRYGQPGVRKVALVGPPGTGKTSMCLNLMDEFKSESAVVLTTHIGGVAHHLHRQRNQKKKTLVILEDAEKSLNPQVADSNVLNFLDGLDQPQMKGGAYVIMTTNHPEQIEPRIIKRPGRIDKLFQVGPLQGSYAVDCAKLYFPEEMFDGANDSAILDVVDNTSGAHIKEIANATIAYCAQNNLPPSWGVARKVFKIMQEDLERVLKYAEDTSALIRKERQMGFDAVV